MRWCVIRHPDLPGQASVAAETAVEAVWKPRGWMRVSGWESDQTLLRPAEYAGAPDLDADPAPVTAEPEPKATAKTSIKEK